MSKGKQVDIPSHTKTEIAAKGHEVMENPGAVHITTDIFPFRLISNG